MDFKRALAPLVEGLIDIHSFSIEEFFVSSFKDDYFYSNDDFYLFSIVPLEGLKKWSEYMETKFAGYQLNSDFKFIRKTAEAWNFKEIEKLYLKENWTQDDLDTFYEKIAPSNGSLFLDEKYKVPKVILSSYMRSGNALTRKMYESITGIATGAAMPNKYIINFAT